MAVERGVPMTMRRFAKQAMSEPPLRVLAVICWR